MNSRRLIVSPLSRLYCALQGSIFSPCAGNRFERVVTHRDEARRIAANIAKLPKALQQKVSG
jgi:hypothetical protein